MGDGSGDYKDLGVVCEIETPDGPVFLVPRYTAHDRIEVTPEDMKKVEEAMRIFPGATLRFSKPGNGEVF